MARRQHPRILVALALCLGLGLGLPAQAARTLDTAEVRANLIALTDTLRKSAEARKEDLPSLLARHGLQGFVLPVPGQDIDIAAAPAALASVDTVDFRPVLTLMSQGLGEEDNRDVIVSQGTRGTVAISFRGGFVTARHLRDAVARHFPNLVGDGTVLRVPVVLWEDTVLSLGPNDRLSLSRPDGAFLVSLGRVEIDGSTLDVAGGVNAHSAEFIPFLSVIGGGSLAIRDALVTGFGFGFTDKFAGLSLLAHPLIPARDRSGVARTRLEDIAGLVLTGAPEAIVAGNRFLDVRGNALRLRRSPGAEVSGNLFAGRSPTNAIRVLDKSDAARVSGNLVLTGERVGVLVEGGSGGVAVEGNVIWRRSGGGIKFSHAPCGIVDTNLILDNRHKGIEVYSSRDMRVFRNWIEGNRSAALWVSGQPPAGVTWIEDNMLRRNGTGLSTATPARLWLVANDLSRQLPRLASGDIMLQSTALARDLHGRLPVLMSTAATAVGVGRPETECWAGTR